ncbi:ATP-binding protein [Streptomyces orinoci]|uniref:ATP-binding protein n=1 Tax=Streptomyces orinoci TaxID=67339 RepID=A0ABV3K1F5_STRON|nr:ATP-binding protein [Streptomyces orinoci]
MRTEMKRRAAHRPGTQGREAADGGVRGGAEEGESEPGWERPLRPGELTAVAEVRAALRRLLAGWGGPGRAATAELLVSELVTNALVHTDGGALVSARLTGGHGASVKGRLRVEVRDFADRHPVLRAPSGARTATSGRGLLLVHSLADGWGVRTHGVGKAVWFELDADGP